MDVIYKKAGHIELIRLRDERRFLKTGVVNSISFPATINYGTLPNGNSSFDLVFSAGKSASVNVALSSFQPKIHSALTSFREAEPKIIEAPILTFGGGIIPTVEMFDIGTVRVIKETGIPPSCTVDLPKTPWSPADIVIHGENGVPFSYTESEPEEKEFLVSGREMFFNVADIGEEIAIAYEATGVDVERMQLDDDMNNDIFHLIIAGEAILRKDGGTVKCDMIVFDRVMPTGDIPSPARQKEPQGWNFTMQVLPPRPGKRMIDIAIQV